MHRQMRKAALALFVLGGTVVALPGRTTQDGQPAGFALCSRGVKDRATGECVRTSSTPTLGHLYPLGLEFSISEDGRVGFGTTSPLAHIEVRSADSIGLFVRSQEQFRTSYGVYATLDDGTTAVTGIVSHDGPSSAVGVSGQVNAPSGYTQGVFGSATSTEGVGVSGYATSSMGPTAGVWGLSRSDQGAGVVAQAAGNGGTALRAINDHPTGNLMEAWVDFGGTAANLRFRVDASGNAFADGAFVGGGADYAESLPKQQPSEHLSSGDVVGVFHGRVTRSTHGASQVRVVSSQPAVLGNHEPRVDPATRAPIAFLGQVPVKVRGPVEVGDFLLASGLGDGIAVAAPADSVSLEDLPRAIGTAWESASGSGIHKVRSSVGLDERTFALHGFRQMQSQLHQTQEKLAELEQRLARLESLLE